MPQDSLQIQNTIKLMHFILQIQNVPIKQIHNIFLILHASETNTVCLASK